MSFLLVVLGVWGSMHLYVFVRVCSRAGLSRWWAAGSAGAGLLLMLAPIAGTVLYMRGHLLTGRIVHRIGMIWAAAFFLFFCTSIAHDLLALGLHLARLVRPVLPGISLGGRRIVVWEAILVLVVCGYSFLEARHVVVERVTIPTQKLPPDLSRLRIVQITDLHLGLSVGHGHLEKVVEIAQAAEPDVLVCTGDLLDGWAPGMEQLAETLSHLRAPLGKYAVTGNHEYYGGLTRAVEFTRQAGFTVLLNEVVQPRKWLSIAGFEDDTARYFGEHATWEETSILGQASEGDYTVVLKHRPVVKAECLALTDLQLSGHTHGGQVFPFTLAIWAVYEYGHGLVELAPGRHLYTSRGAGTWGPPMRFLNPPEVTVIDLVRDGT